ncbi:hypothetical protein SBA4_2150024 [Candidatus Sulfopaludibacter sp. SbA4]|nr:hypothetical protein SBA4_2150024 [Candidatus Sulfopaludibacter sp. SbA4]
MENTDDAVRAVENVGHLSRAQCRASFEDRFDAARMAANYERVYQRLLHSAPPPAYARGSVISRNGAATVTRRWRARERIF